MTCVQAQRMAQIEAQLAKKDEVNAKIIERLSEQERTLDSLKDWTETRLDELKDGFADLDSRLGKIIDALSDLTEKMRKELESLEQAGIDDGNSVELASAPAEGE